VRIHNTRGENAFVRQIREIYGQENRSEIIFVLIYNDAFFFLDTIYPNLYNKNYHLKKSDPIYKTPPYVDTLEIYIEKIIYQLFINDSSGLFARASDDQLHYFIKLIPDFHYELFKDQGYIRFDTIIYNSDLVAIYLRAGDGQIRKGKRADTLSLWTLKPREPITAASGDPERFLGLTNDAGNPLTDYGEIYDINHEYIILPPYDTCPTCNEPFNNPALGAEYRDSVLYRFSDQSDLWRHYVSLYYFETTGKMKPRD